MKVDLHTHSAFSDGELSPEQLAGKLAAAGVQWASLVDHETTRGWVRFGAALAEYNIRAIPGVEIEVRFRDGLVHLLAWGFDPQDSGFLRYLRALRHPLMHRVEGWLGLGGQARPAVSQASAAEAIARIHQAGGLAVLAHPLDHARGIEAGAYARLERDLADLAACGLDGLEAYYKPYPSPDQEKLAALARCTGLLVGAGSDYHGDHSPNGAPPGVEMPEDGWLALLAALRSRAAVSLAG